VRKTYNEANCRTELDSTWTNLMQDSVAFLPCLNVPEGRVIDHISSLYRDSCCEFMTH